MAQTQVFNWPLQQASYKGHRPGHLAMRRRLGCLPLLEVFLQPMKQVLVVDDDPFFHVLMKRIVKSLDITIACAAGVEEGLTLARELKPSLIIMDIYLPRINGWYGIQAIKQDQQLRSIPIIVVTAGGLGNEEKKAREAGCTGFFRKPFSIEDMCSVIKSCAQSHPSEMVAGGRP
jgi:two-component system cell cycle response regulator DivK